MYTVQYSHGDNFYSVDVQYKIIVTDSAEMVILTPTTTSLSSLTLYFIQKP